MSCCEKDSHSLSESQVESHISDIRGNVEEAVDGVKKLASLRRYNATHSVLGTRWHRSLTWTMENILFFNKWYRTYSFINTRYYGSKEDYDKDAQTKYDNSRRYRDPISINDRWIKFANFAILNFGKQLYGIFTYCWNKNLPLRSIVEDLTNVTAKNATLTRGWKECNVILFPILVFGVFCLAVVLVLIRYKVCANYDEEEKEEGDQAK